MTLVNESTGEVIAPLTDDEAARLGELEQIIHDGQDAFLRVGAALLEINDSRLYREEHATFEDYCASAWGFTRSYGYRLIAAAEVVAEMSPMGDTPLPTNERQARALGEVDPAKRADVMRKAAEDGPPTAPKIAAAAAEIDPALKLRQEQAAARAARKAEADAKRARESAAEADLMERAAEEFDDVAAAALNRKTRDALDNLSAVLACDPDAAAMACPDSQTPARLAQLDLLVQWASTHRARLNGTPLHVIRGAG